MNKKLVNHVKQDQGKVRTVRQEQKQIILFSIDVPNWCNPATGMGAWLNFPKMRLWCASNGWTDFGPYGGVPSNKGTDSGDPQIQAQTWEGEGGDYDDLGARGDFNDLDTRADSL